MTLRILCYLVYFMGATTALVVVGVALSLAGVFHPWLSAREADLADMPRRHDGVAVRSMTAATDWNTVCIAGGYSRISNIGAWLRGRDHGLRFFDPELPVSFATNLGDSSLPEQYGALVFLRGNVVVDILRYEYYAGLEFDLGCVEGDPIFRWLESAADCGVGCSGFYGPGLYLIEAH